LKNVAYHVSTVPVPFLLWSQANIHYACNKHCGEGLKFFISNEVDEIASFNKIAETGTQQMSSWSGQKGSY